MNIKITITTASDEVTLDIPIMDVLKAAKQSSAVTTSLDHHRPAHGPFPVDSDGFGLEDVSRSFENCEDRLLINLGEGMEKGGEKVGLGRIGGVGERKEREDEGRKREGEPQLTQSIYTMEFDLADGTSWTPASKMVYKHCQLFGHHRILEQYLLAQQWLIEHPHLRKTERGMGSFLTKWLKRSVKFEQIEDEKRRMAEAQKQSASNLLRHSNETQSHW